MRSLVALLEAVGCRYRARFGFDGANDAREDFFVEPKGASCGCE